MSIINSSINAINFEIPGVGMVSTAAYAEFNKLREGYEGGKDIFDWEYNPYFLMVLYNYYKATWQRDAATALKNAIRSGWYHEGFHGITVGYLSKEDEFTVEVEEISEGGYFESRVITGKAAWEALRDISLKVVLNYN